MDSSDDDVKETDNSDADDMPNKSRKKLRKMVSDDKLKVIMIHLYYLIYISIFR